MVAPNPGMVKEVKLLPMRADRFGSVAKGDMRRDTDKERGHERRYGNPEHVGHAHLPREAIT